jgi:hypothetical protein
MPVAALASAAVVAGLLPDTGWSDALALLAITAALVAAHERRHRDMAIAAALGVALSPAGLLLAPLCLGLAIGRGAVRHLPVAAVIGLLVATRLPWTTPTAQLPNLATLPAAWPASLALVAAIGVGASAWLAARGSITRPVALFAEARLGIVVLAMLLPLPPGVLSFVVMILALPCRPPSGAKPRTTISSYAAQSASPPDAFAPPSVFRHTSRLRFRPDSARGRPRLQECSSVGRASVSKTEGPRFESVHSCQFATQGRTRASRRTLRKIRLTDE